MKRELPLLIYDSECTLCTRFKFALEKLPKKKDIFYASIHDEDIYEEFTLLTKDACQQKVHLITESHEILAGPDVIAYLVQTIPLISELSWLLEKDAGKKSLDFFYDVANKYRTSLLNRCKSCKK